MRLCLFTLLFFQALGVHASICVLPPTTILSPSLTDRLVADVTVIGKVPSILDGYPDSSIVEVSAVFTGSSPRQIVVLSAPPELNSFGCNSDLQAFPVGSRLLINVHQDAGAGTYGGDGTDYYAAVVEGEATGWLVPPDCPEADFECQRSRTTSTMSIEEFYETADSSYPGQLMEKPSIEFGRVAIRLSEGKASVGSEIGVEFVVPNDCTWVEPNAVRVNPQMRTIDFSYQFVSIENLDITPAPICFPGPRTLNVPVGRAYEAERYAIRVYSETLRDSSEPFQLDQLAAEFSLDVEDASLAANAETPSEGSIQSGIGLIRGWACDARSVIVQFNNLPPLELAYGTARPDTAKACGDINNGYGTVFAWGSLGEGMHTMTTWIDGREVSLVEFEVRGLDEPFITGLSGEYQLDDFPETGAAVWVRWSQPDQNFVVVGRSE